MKHTPGITEYAWKGQVLMSWVQLRRHYIQQNDIQQNDIQQNDIQQNDIQQNDI
jgi:hypothetical protein